MSRLRGPAARLRDTPIWAKLGLIMVVPTIATVVVGTSGLVTHIQTQSTAERARDLAILSQSAGQLVHDLQNERAAAAMFLATSGTDERAKAAYTASHQAVEGAKRPYAQQRNTVSDLPQNFQTLLNQIDTQLSGLPGLRSQVTGAQQIKLSEAAGDYQVLIRFLLSIRDWAGQLAGNNDLGERVRAASEVSRIKDFMSQRRVVVHQIFNQNRFEPQLRTEYLSTHTGERQAREDFETVSTRQEREFYEQTVSGSVLRKTDTYQGYLNSKAVPEISDIRFNAAEWDTAMRDQADLVRAVESELDKRIVAQATSLRDVVQQRVLLETGLLLGMLLLAMLFAWLVARSMARSLRELRHGALSVAEYGLPQAVARLRDPSLSTQLSPVQVAEQIAEPLPVRSKDEFGQVTAAFNAVHLEAVRTAAEQAALRSSVGTMFVNLARRSQILVDRLIGHLDRLERGEEDPDRLAELFQLDHLATRMRRNDENLLVLAGADSTRVQREPAALIDVLRAAQSEVEHYTRIEFGMIDRDIEVAAHAVNDLVHLVAELFDNATAFSPPDSHVMVEARRVGDRAVLYVEDRGIGITAEQMADLNERLASPPQVDVAVSRMMGLVVVARLAARHNVRVELRAASERGTIADVTLPPAVLVPRAHSGRLQSSPSQAAQPSAFRSVGPSAPTSSLPFAAPLALESASSVSPRSAPPLSGRPFEPAVPVNGGHGGPGRGMPAWSDLTGATAANGNDSFQPRTPNGQRTDPLPQRRGTENWPADANGSTAAHPIIPRQGGLPESRPPMGLTPGGNPPALPSVSAPPVVSAPPSTPGPQSRPAVPAAASAPPAWPPVARDAPPAVPEKLAAALDMTAELPRVRPGDSPAEGTPPAAHGATSTPSPKPAARPNPQTRPTEQPRQRFVDETMELPIFRELESAWFRTRRSASDEPLPAAHVSPAAPAKVDPARTAAQPAKATTGGGSSTAPAREPAVEATPAAATAPAARSAERPAQAWQTAADDGWRAASAAADVPVNETTSAGLPKRTPMAQLVPGGIDKGEKAVQRRTPEGVRGLLSAYHRGVQRGRTQPKDESPTSTQPTPAGQQSAQAGKEHDA